MSDQPRNLEPMLRASDADREQTLTVLRAHHAAGRLQTNELDERVTAVLTATTVAELDQQLRDLPDPGDHRNHRHRARLVPMILPLATASTAIAVGTETHLIWILPLLWFAGPWRHRSTRPRRGRRTIRPAASR
jgi:Domain of unknown function (DUF1707)